MATIRTARKQDLKQLVQIERQSFSNPYPQELLQLLVQSAPDLFLVATDDTREKSGQSDILGYAAANILEQQHGRVGHIVSIAIKPTHRRQGIGTHLIEELIRRFRCEKCVQIRLEVRTTNNAAISLYKKLGFHQVNIIPKYYSNRENAALLELDLEDVS